MSDAYALDGAILDPTAPVVVGDTRMSYATMLRLSDAERAAYGIATVTVPPAPPSVPDNPTLGDWRVGLVLWGRLDDLLARVRALIDTGNPIGRVAQERVEYSNNVLRDQLMLLKDVFGFSEAEIDESLWRADRVRQGDLSGVWPV